MSELLFRAEVIAARGARLHGEVILASTLPAWLTTGFVTLAAAGALTWAGLASYARTEQVAGVVASIQPLAKVIAPRPGLVTRVAVHDGDIVRAGDPLVTVQVEQMTAGGTGSASASLAAIDAQRELAQQRLALEPARAAAERTRLNATIIGAVQTQTELAEQLMLQNSVIVSTKQSFDQIKPVVDKGFMTRAEYERRRQAWLQAEQGRRALMQQRDAAASTAAQARAELQRVPIDTAGNLSQLHAAIQQLAQGRAQQSADQGYAALAPIAGRVTALQAAPGRFADGHVPLLTIVPEHAVMRAELYAPSRSIGFIVPGQAVRLLYDAFPYQRFGSFGGHVEAVSRAVITPAEVDAPLQLKESVYRVTVRLDRQRVHAFGTDIPLQPGMTLAANIVLERRTFLDWLLDPLRAVANRS